MERTPVASRVSAEPTTLVIARIGQPLRRAAFTAPSVSAVSPDWDTATTSVSGPTIASRERNSEARATSAGGVARGPTLVRAVVAAGEAGPPATDTTRRGGRAPGRAR